MNTAENIDSAELLLDYSLPVIVLLCVVYLPKCLLWVCNKFDNVNFFRYIKTRYVLAFINLLNVWCNGEPIDIEGFIENSDNENL